MSIFDNLVRLVNENKRCKIESILKSDVDKYVRNYSILVTALEDDVEQVDDDYLKELYGIKDNTELIFLSEADCQLAIIIKTLSVKTGRDIEKEFFNHFKLDVNQPELLFLIDLVEEVLKSK